LEIAALDDGAIVEVAVVDVVDGVAEDVALVGFAIDLGVEVAKRGGGDYEEGAGEIIGFEEFWRPGDLVVANAFRQIGREFGADNVDMGAGLEEAGDFLGGDGASAYDEDAAVGEFQECGEQGH
jgi:hypothetical protein